MPLAPLRTLPAVGNRLPIRMMLSSFADGEEHLKLRPFENAPATIFTSSGTAALIVALDACRRTSPRRKVIIPAYTCPSVLAAVEQAGLTAVLCDLAPGRLALDREQLSSLLDEDTLAVVYVHLFGLDSEADKIGKLIRAAGAWMIEDAAQAFGNHRDGRFLGSEGDLTVLSFGRGKPVSVLHGGAVVVNNPRLVKSTQEAFERLAAPLPHWFGSYYRVLVAAYAFLFDPKWFGLPQALPWFRIGQTVYIRHTPVHAMAMAAMRILKPMLSNHSLLMDTRARVAAKYLQRLREQSAVFEFLPTSVEISTGPLRFPVVFREKNLKTECLSKLSDLRLGATGSYPVPLHRQSGVSDRVAAQGPFPNAEAIARGILTLPTHEYVTDPDIALITDTICELAQ